MIKRSWTQDLLLLALTTIFFFLLFFPLAAQSPEDLRPGGCGHEALHQKLMQDPTYRSNMERMETAVQRFLQQGSTPLQARASTACTAAPVIYRIPIVVHAVHYTASTPGNGANLTDASIINTINLINDRFRHTSGLTFANPFSGADTRIELVFATRDPSGNPTTGINHYADDVNAENVYGTDNTQLAYFWPTDDYFNLYLVETICDAGSCPASNGVGGYAYLPGSHGANFDGAVFLAGSFWSGLVAHEAGHYFGLRHTFQGGCVNNDCTTDGDGVCDTPPKANAGYGTGTCVAPGDDCNADEDDLSTNNPFRPVASGGLGAQDDGLENYMDYSAACWDAFTAGQGDRMEGFITTTRASLLSSAALVPFVTDDAGITAINYPVDDICSAPFIPEVTLTNGGTSALTSCNIRLELNTTLVQTFAWAGSIAPGASQTVSLNPVSVGNGTHLLYAYTDTPNGVADSYAENDATCIEFDFFAPISTFPLSEGFETATFAPTNFSLYNPDGNYTFERSTAAGGFGASTASAIFDNFTWNTIGNVDELRTNVLDFSALTSIQLTFDVAYCRYSGGNFDGLEVLYSLDCGQNWTSLFNQSGTALATAPDQTTLFVPTATQWRNENIDLSAAGLNGAPSVMLAFRNLPGWGNALYLDNINLDASVPLDVQAFQLYASTHSEGVDLQWEFLSDIPAERFEIQRLQEGVFQPLAEQTAEVGPRYFDPSPLNGLNVYRIQSQDLNGELAWSNQVQVHHAAGPIRIYPNPFQESLTIQGELDWSQAQVTLLDLTGSVVKNLEFQGESPRQTFVLSELPAGLYFVRIQAPGRNEVFKVLKP